MKLTITGDTWFKKSSANASTLPDSEKFSVKEGTEFLLSAYRDVEDNHILVTFNTKKVDTFKLHPSGHNTWRVFNKHCVIEGNLKNNQPKDDQPNDNKGRLIKIPGKTNNVGTLEKIVPGGNFTWGEATAGGSRIPVHAGITRNIIEIAEYMEEVRERLGNKPIRITSWYRPPHINRAIGGASQSRHLTGDAVDFWHSTLAPKDVYAKLNPWWGSKGGLAFKHRAFTHIDGRGYKARWRY